MLGPTKDQEYWLGSSQLQTGSLDCGLAVLALHSR